MHPENRTIYSKPVPSSRLFLDDPTVLDRLRSSLTDALAVQDNYDRLIQEGHLQQLYDTVEELEIEDSDMYPHLSAIFNIIESRLQESVPVSFFQMSHVLPKLDSTLFNRSNGCPDLSLLDLAGHSRDASAFSYWQQRSGWIMFGLEDTLDPPKSDPILSKFAEHALYHLYGRPFQLFSAGLLICGVKFRVAIVDADGLSMSPTFSYWSEMAPNDPVVKHGLTTLIQVVRRMSQEMTDVELGLDPTVSIIPSPSNIYPFYRVNINKETWQTDGLPLWSSHGLFESVWEVNQVIDNERTSSSKLMKMSWRSSTGRTSVSELYRTVSLAHNSIGKLYAEEDVHHNGNPIMAAGLHRVSYEDTHVLHRALFDTGGRPLWYYANELELLQAFYDAIAGHRYLCQNGILHRGISPGSVLLHDAGHKGDSSAFILGSDRAVAWSQDMGPTSQQQNPELDNEPTNTSENAMFASIELLYAALREVHVAHRPSHDVESFIWLFPYVVMRHLLLQTSLEEIKIEDQPAEQVVYNWLSSYYGSHLSVSDIKTLRHSRTPLVSLHAGIGPLRSMGYVPPLGESLGLSPVVLQVLAQLHHCLDVQDETAFAASPELGMELGEEISWEVVLGVFDRAIRKLSDK